MSFSLGKRLLRWLDPKTEEQRMQMRKSRCIAEANAEDLMRTISVNREHVQDLMRDYRAGHTNGKEKDL